jgi:hypothetical protein
MQHRSQRALAEANVRDLDGRVARLDAMVQAATKRGYTRTANARRYRPPHDHHRDLRSRHCAQTSADTAGQLNRA